MIPTRLGAYRLIVIMPMHSNDTPMLPYCMNGMTLQRKSPCVQVPCMKRKALKGSTRAQNNKSAKHKLKMEIKMNIT